VNEDSPCHVNSLAIHKIYAEGNIESIAETIPINISKTPSIMENIFIGEDCSPKEIQIYIELFKEFHENFSLSYEDILGIDPSIVEHEITTNPNVKLEWKTLFPINPRNTTMIKAKVEKLIKVGFIYPVILTEWVSNHVPIDKNKGMIHLCMDFCDLNKAWPKDNFPTALID
jgi:hypothetical protein